MTGRSPLPWYHRSSPWIGGAFGFVAGVYTALTGDVLTWRTSGDPILPTGVLFDVHPLFGIAVFTVAGFGVGLVERYLEREFVGG